TLELSREIGLGDRLLAASESAGKNRFLFLRGKLRKLPTGPGSFLLRGIVSWRAKLALLPGRFAAPRRADADESLDAFVRRRLNGELADTLADAFVTGIHAGGSRLLSVRAAFPRLVQLEQEHGSVLKGMAAGAKQRRAEAAAKGVE